MGFERCHPAVNFLYFFVVLAAASCFRHPLFLAVSLASAAVYSAYRNGRRTAILMLVLLLCVAAFVLYYTSYTHFGVTVLRKSFTGNNMTLEALVYGTVLGLSAACCCLWMSCVFCVFTTDKVVYLFGRLSPQLSLFLSIVLRMVPRIKREAMRISTARQGIGKGLRQGNVLCRLRSAADILSMLITWTVDTLIGVSGSMRSRGSALRGRTAFSVYRFDNRDRAYVVVMFFCMTVTMTAVLLGYTDMTYDPVIVWRPQTPLSVLLCVGYAALCLMPLGLEMWTDFCFRKSAAARIEQV